MKYFIYAGMFLGLTLASCTSDENTPVEKAEEQVVEADTTSKSQDDIIAEKMELVEIIGDMFTEYYPGKKNVKFKGPQDENGKRHGMWMYFSEDGVELSMTNYEHGIKHGPTMVKYPNGNLHYSGEYANDKPVGLWVTYRQNGEKSTEKDYGYPE